jgi:hypothetical protein
MSQYVVMPLWTFVCTGCSGLHREFSHRVLSSTLHSFTKDPHPSLRWQSRDAGNALSAPQILKKIPGEGCSRPAEDLNGLPRTDQSVLRRIACTGDEVQPQAADSKPSRKLQKCPTEPLKALNTSY